MPLAIIGAIFGIFLGWRRAAKADGNLLDKLHYATIHGIGFALAGFILAIVLVRFF